MLCSFGIVGFQTFLKSALEIVNSIQCVTFHQHGYHLR